jgi:glycosyltransferase involved in cell wall biosynthesis
VGLSLVKAPRLTIGLPVYNGENYVAESIDAILGQTFEDFVLVISDNASTDSTGDICRQYEKDDTRVRYIRQPRNVGLAPNHNFLAARAETELFKWASHDDLYARDLLARCIEALDSRPEVVLAHSWTAMIDDSGSVTRATEYPLDTSSRSVPARFHSLLFDSGGDDDGGVVRLELLRRVAKKNSYHHADRTTMTELALYGPFYHVPDWLYFRRDHPARAERACPTVRSRCANMDPRRANRFRHPVVRLYAEYAWAYVAALQRAPISNSDRVACYRVLARWLLSRSRPGHNDPQVDDDTVLPDVAPPDSVVAGRQSEAD